MKFRVSGKTYEIELDPETLMGDELLVVEDHVGMDLQEWGAKLASGRFGIRDILVLTFLAERRGGGVLPWDQFVKTIAPLTFRVLGDDKPAEQPAVEQPALVSEVGTALHEAIADHPAEPEDSEQPVKKTRRRKTSPAAEDAA